MRNSRECLQRMAIVVAAFMLIAAFSAQAQLSGSKSVGGGGDYATIAIAIDSLNAQGVGAGGVTFNVAGNHTETSSNLVIAITTNPPTAANPVVFQKSGAGANPLITATPGVSASTDGIIKLSGTDYITFDRIDLLDPATNAGDAMMEWGYAVLRASPTDGSRFVTIKNCVITLQKINTSSNGIYHANRDINGVTTNWTDSLGQNSNNRYFGNTISNVYHGIQALSSSTARDENNEIGVVGELANTITNWGGSTVTTNGIRCEGQVNLKISNNVINGGAGTSGSAAVHGIITTLFGTSALVPNYEISHNTVTVSTTPTSQGTWGIRALATGDTVRLHNNIVENSVVSQNTSTFNALSHEPSGRTRAVYMHDNIIRNNELGGTGSMNLLYFDGPANRAYIYSNTVHGNQKTGLSGILYCIRVVADSGMSSSYNNVVYNNSIPFSSGSSAAIVYGLSSTGGGGSATDSLYGNSVYNLSLGGSSTSTSSVVYGIYAATGSSSSSVAKWIYGNTVHTLSSGVGTTGGIYQQYGSSSQIHGNNIYNLSTAAGSLAADTAKYVAGIVVAGALGTAATTVHNNFISDLRAPGLTNRNGVIGINATVSSAGTSLSAYYNTIYLNATSTGANFGSSGISSVGSATPTTATLTLINNIVVNNSVANGTGLTVALRRTTANLANYSTSSNNNCLYTTPSASNLIFHNGTDGDSTLVDYQARVTPADVASFSIMPSFINPTTAPYNLHIQTAVASQIESGGTSVGGITTDIDGDLRFGAPGYAGGGTAPDVGADEMEGTPLASMTYVSSTTTQDTNAVFANTTNNHVLGIEIVTAGFSSPLTVTSFTLNTSGSTNATGDITTARIFYTGQSSTFGTGVEVGSFVSPPAGPATYAITGSQTLVNGTNYFWLTYDVPISATGGNVVDGQVLSITVSATPQTPSVTSPAGNKTIIGSSSGAYTLGPDQPYPYNSFSGVAALLGSAGVSGPVVFNLQSGPETVFNEQVEFTAIPGASSTNTITFNGNGATLTYAPTATNRHLIRLNGVQWLTINNLTIIGTDTTYGWGVHLINGADNNAITNCTIDLSAGKNTSTTHNLVGIVASGSTTSVTTAGNNANYCVFSGNTIQGSAEGGPQGGIRINGNTGGLNAVGNQIVNNIIRDFYEDGIRLSNNDGTLVRGNEISRANRMTVTIFRGLTLTAGCRNVRIEKNRIHSTNAVGANPSATAYGIHFDLVDAPLGSENVAINNMLYKFTSVTGIVWAIYNSGSDGAHYYFNSVSIDHPDAVGGTSTTRGFFQTTTAVNVIFRNNIVSISRGGGSTKHCLYFATPASTIESNNNLLYINAPAGTNSVGYLSTSYATLVDWQATGHDTNSVEGNPAFLSLDDLHINTAAVPSSPASNAGAPIVGITDDFDGDTRDVSTPDIGADEFTVGSVNVGVSIAAGWNMISNPVTTSDDSVRQLYPNASFNYAFAFVSGAGYAQRFTLDNGSGYWEKFPGAETNMIAGSARTVDTVEVQAGWNMVGSLSYNLDTANVSDPGGIRLTDWYGYSGGYSPATQILAGKAYWVKASAPGVFIFNISPSPSKAAATPVNLLEGLDMLVVTDNSGSSQTLYLGARPEPEASAGRYAMPPLPPTGGFDARFETADGGAMVRLYGPDATGGVFPVAVQSESYPLTVSWNISNGVYELSDGQAGEVLSSRTLAGEGSMQITNSALRRFEVRLVSNNQVPEEFALQQNYPNPFNPVTNIRFALPVESRVLVEVYNMLGQRVRTLLSEELAAGYHTVAWNGTGITEQQLGSGVYFVRMNATGADGRSFVELKKMMFLK